MALFPLIAIGTSLLGGITQKKASDKAAAAAKAAGEFNASAGQPDLDGDGGR